MNAVRYTAVGLVAALVVLATASAGLAQLKPWGLSYTPRSSGGTIRYSGGGYTGAVGTPVGPVPSTYVPARRYTYMPRIAYDPHAFRRYSVPYYGSVRYSGPAKYYGPDAYRGPARVIKDRGGGAKVIGRGPGGGEGPARVTYHRSDGQLHACRLARRARVAGDAPSLTRTAGRQLTAHVTLLRKEVLLCQAEG